MPLAGLPRLLIFVTVSALLRQPAASAQALPECPTPAVRLLSTTLGRWEVTWRDRITPDRYDTTQARATIEPTARGCGLLERFEGTRDGRPFSALTLIGPVGGDSLQRIWQDSGHGMLLVFGGLATMRPLRFEWRRDLGERSLRVRHTYLALAPDSFVTQTELSRDDGRSWAIVSHLIYRRSPR
jgi:hypothetical protein